MIHRRFLGRLVNRPQLITPAAGAAVLEAVLPGAQLLGYSDPPAADGRSDRDFQVAGTTAIIPVVGELVHRGGWMDALSGVASYQALGDMLTTALGDRGVESVVLDLDSPGGEAAGCLDFAEWLAGQRGTKPIWAMVNQLACSAAYAIASACDRIVVGESGYVGSIGVVAYHADISQALDRAGIKVTYIAAGAHKTDFAPELPLTQQAFEAGQRAVDAEYDRFCRVVAANRGMALAAVRATEAAIFRGRDAVSAGLADDIATPEEALAAMTTTVQSAPSGARLSAKPATVEPTEPQPAPVAAAEALPAPASAPAPAPAPTQEVEQPAAPQAVAEACSAAGHATLIAGLLKHGATMKAVEARLATATAITEAAKPLGLSAIAQHLVAEGVGLEAARHILFEAKAGQDGTVRTDPTNAGATGKPAAKLDRRGIYARMNGQKG